MLITRIKKVVGETMGQVICQNDIAIKVALARLQACLAVILGVFGDREALWMAGAFHGRDRHLGFDIQRERELNNNG